MTDAILFIGEIVTVIESIATLRHIDAYLLLTTSKFVVLALANVGGNGAVGSVEIGVVGAQQDVVAFVEA